VIAQKPLGPLEFEHATVPIGDPPVAGLAVVQQRDEHHTADGVAERRGHEKAGREGGEGSLAAEDDVQDLRRADDRVRQFRDPHCIGQREDQEHSGGGVARGMH